MSIPVKSLAKKFAAARRYRINAIEQRDIGMNAARACKAAGRVDQMRLCVQAARIAQHLALTISKSVL